MGFIQPDTGDLSSKLFHIIILIHFAQRRPRLVGAYASKATQALTINHQMYNRSKTNKSLSSL